MGLRDLFNGNNSKEDEKNNVENLEVQVEIEEEFRKELKSEISNAGKYSQRDYAMMNYWMNAKYLLDTDIIKAQVSREFPTVNLSKMDLKMLNKLTAYKLSQIGKNSFTPEKQEYMKDIDKFLEVLEKIENNAKETAKKYQYKEELAEEFVGVEGVENAINECYNSYIEEQNMQKDINIEENSR